MVQQAVGFGSQNLPYKTVSVDEEGDPLDPATQATLAAILAKLIAAPATEATAAAILAKLIAAPATSAKQDTIIAALAAVVGGAGEAHLGQVGGHSVPVVATLTRTADTNAYAANDAIANAVSGAALPFVLAGRAAYPAGAGSGIIVGLLLQVSNAAATHRVEVDIYNDTITALQDNAEATRLVADVAKWEGTITLPALAKKTANSTVAEAAVFDIRIPFKCVAASKLHFVPRTLDAHTPASGTVYTFTYKILQD